MSHITLDAEVLYTDLRQSVRPLLRPGSQLLGIASGGVWLAQRLAQDLGRQGPVGVISSTLHRDDYARRGMTASAQTQIPFTVEGADILLLDDVLYTGRTVRAVLNELFDFGRPASVRLAVLVDRGGRELPIAPDFCAARINLPHEQSITLARDDEDDGRFIFNIQTR
ncbi:MAG: bifunctional pyr operon transcriptional regulator/uracil phosphoribosyltransferase PyrR [Rhodoferax sp.]